MHGSSFFKKENMIKNTIETKLAFLIFVAVKLNMQLIIITILRIFYFNVLYLELELAAKISKPQIGNSRKIIRYCILIEDELAGRL